MSDAEKVTLTDWQRGHRDGWRDAAAWLREQAAENANGSRDFGRGFMLAANLLAETARPLTLEELVTDGG